MHITLIKTQTGFAPADPETEEFAKKIKIGSVIHSDFKRMRNYEFHKKLFALLNLAFEYWEPGIVSSKYGIPIKSFEQFRHDLIILAGYYHTEIRLNGSVRVVPDSISFSNMEQDTFEKLYQNVLTVIMDKIPVLDKMTEDEINDLVNKVIAFA